MELSFGTRDDLEAWMRLVELVGEQFPGLETRDALEAHRDTVMEFMDRASALCVRTRESLPVCCCFHGSGRKGGLPEHGVCGGNADGRIWKPSPGICAEAVHGTFPALKGAAPPRPQKGACAWGRAGV